MTWEDSYLQRVQGTIRRYGHAVQYASGDPATGERPFAYTVGLHTGPRTDYELAISGLEPEASAGILNALAAQFAAGGLPPAEALEIGGVLQSGYTLRLRRVSHPERCPVIAAVYGTIPPVWQAIWPDLDNRFPGEAGSSAEQQQL